MKNLVKRFGLPPVEFHPIVLGYEVDFRDRRNPDHLWSATGGSSMISAAEL